MFVSPIGGKNHILKFANIESIWCKDFIQEKYSGHIEALKKVYWRILTQYCNTLY
jgi:hypothetical protein